MIGRVVIGQLLAADESLRIVAVSRRADPAFAGLSRCDPIQGDVFDRDSLDRVVRRADLVVNLAARNPVGIEQDWAARRDFFLVNALAAGLVAASAQRHGVPLVHFSTVSVYETAEYRGARLLSEEEEMPRIGKEIAYFHAQSLEILVKLVATRLSPAGHVSPANGYERFLARYSCPDNAPVYGLSKLIGETLTLRVNEKVCCLRMSDVYGPGHESRGVIVEHLRQLGSDKIARVDFGFRTNICFIFISDIVRLLALLMPRLLSNCSSLCKVINFSGERIVAAGMQSHLLQLCAMRELRCGIDLAPSARPQFDRRYSTDVFENSFPGFEQTPFKKGLRLTLDALWDDRFDP